MKIGALARLANVSVSTIHYLEKQGLMPPPPRTATGLRVYGEDAVRRLVFIRDARALELPLEQVALLLALSDGVGDKVQLAERSLEYFDSRIAQLQRLKDCLTEIAMSSDADGPVEGRRILDAL